MINLLYDFKSIVDPAVPYGEDSFTAAYGSHERLRLQNETSLVPYWVDHWGMCHSYVVKDSDFYENIISFLADKVFYRKNYFGKPEVTLVNLIPYSLKDWDDCVAVTIFYGGEYHVIGNLQDYAAKPIFSPLKSWLSQGYIAQTYVHIDNNRIGVFLSNDFFPSEFLNDDTDSLIIGHSFTRVGKYKVYQEELKFLFEKQLQAKRFPLKNIVRLKLSYVKTAKLADRPLIEIFTYDDDKKLGELHHVKSKELHDIVKSIIDSGKTPYAELGVNAGYEKGVLLYKAHLGIPLPGEYQVL